MKLTKQQLKRIIKEEIGKIMSEALSEEEEIKDFITMKSKFAKRHNDKLDYMSIEKELIEKGYSEEAVIDALNVHHQQQPEPTLSRRARKRKHKANVDRAMSRRNRKQ